MALDSIYNRLILAEMESHLRQQIKEQHNCPICLDVLFSPIKLRTCDHIFCQSCLVETQIASNASRCSLCRKIYQQGDLIKYTELQQLILKQYPQAIAQRRKFIKERVEGKVRIGNNSVYIQGNQQNNYKWTVYVRSAMPQQKLSDYVERVEFGLHPTFNPQNVTINVSGNKPVELTRYGWGTFRIDVKVFWKAGRFVEPYSDFFHDLEFVPLKQNEVRALLTLKQ